MLFRQSQNGPKLQLLSHTYEDPAVVPIHFKYIPWAVSNSFREFLVYANACRCSHHDYDAWLEILTSIVVKCLWFPCMYYTWFQVYDILLRRQIWREGKFLGRQLFLRAKPNFIQQPKCDDVKSWDLAVTLEEKCRLQK